MNNNYRSEKRKIIKIITKNLNDIYKSGKEICNEWDKNTIPLNLLHTIIDKAKPSPLQRKQEKSLDAYANTLDSLELALNKIATNMDSKSVPLSELLKGLKIIKTAFIGEWNRIDEEKAKTNLIKKQ